MKIIETRPREIVFVLLGHCQNLLDDPRTSTFNDNLQRTRTSASFASFETHFEVTDNRKFKPGKVLPKSMGRFCILFSKIKIIKAFF